MVEAPGVEPVNVFKTPFISESYERHIMVAQTLHNTHRQKML
jgi:hypothetical protein